MAQLQFNAAAVAPDTGFDLLPAGWYKAMVDESEMKPTKAEGGAYLNCRFTIVEGPFTGRKLFCMLNLRNSNAQAVEIAQKQLSAIVHATLGPVQIEQSEQFHNIPMKIKVKIRKDKTGEYEDQNQITQWKNVNEPVGDELVNAPAPGQFQAPPGMPPPNYTSPPSQQGSWPSQQPPPPAQAAPPPPLPPPAPPAPPAVQRPTDPAYIHAPGTPGEMWFINGAWQPAVAAAPPPPPPPPGPGAAPAGWQPPGQPNSQPWAHQPPAQGAPAAPPTPPAPPHPAQSATPPWHNQPR